MTEIRSLAIYASFHSPLLHVCSSLLSLLPYHYLCTLLSSSSSLSILPLRNSYILFKEQSLVSFIGSIYHSCRDLIHSFTTQDFTAPRPWTVLPQAFTCTFVKQHIISKTSPNTIVISSSSNHGSSYLCPPPSPPRFHSPSGSQKPSLRNRIGRDEEAMQYSRTIRL